MYMDVPSRLADITRSMDRESALEDMAGYRCLSAKRGGKRVSLSVCRKRVREWKTDSETH